MSRVWSFCCKSIRYWLLCLLPVLLWQCATPPIHRPEGPPQEFTASQVLEKLRNREAAITSLKGLFRADIDGEGVPFAHRINGTVLYQRPDTLRLKGFTRFGGIVFDFLMRSGVYSLRVPDEDKVIVGNADQFDRLGEFHLPVQLSLRAMEVLLGKIAWASDPGVRVVKEGNDYQFDRMPTVPSHNVTFPMLSQRVWIDRFASQVKRLEYVTAEGEVAVSIRTSEFRRVRDASPVESSTIVLPFSVEAEDRVQSGSVTLEFLEMVANESLPDREFSSAAFLQSLR